MHFKGIAAANESSIDHSLSRFSLKLLSSLYRNYLELVQRQIWASNCLLRDKF